MQTVRAKMAKAELKIAKTVVWSTAWHEAPETKQGKCDAINVRSMLFFFILFDAKYQPFDVFCVSELEI